MYYIHHIHDNMHYMHHMVFDMYTIYVLLGRLGPYQRGGAARLGQDQARSQVRARVPRMVMWVFRLDEVSIYS